MLSATRSRPENFCLLLSNKWLVTSEVNTSSTPPMGMVSSPLASSSTSPGSRLKVSGLWKWSRSEILRSCWPAAAAWMEWPRATSAATASSSASDRSTISGWIMLCPNLKAAAENSLNTAVLQSSL